MNGFVLTTTLLVALLLLVYLPISTVGLPKIWWHKQSEQADARHLLKGPSSETTRLVGLALLSQAPNSSPSPTGLFPWLPIIPKLPNLPGLPNIPKFPNIPGLPPLPGLPRLPDLPPLPPLPGLPSLPRLPPLPPY
ncbi:unnamed protein product [Brassica oleracea var. botrytis]|uniref:Uncharacterized protein n=1 Tax=Brassica oleracea TaxID=3712 RepID=A0A3P6EY40_BRAOL|nr:unnamed protein product [Brassica oleracea]